MKYLIVLFLCASGVFFGQINTFKGKVVDSETQKPLSQANVSLIDSKQGVVTNEKGDFEIAAGREKSIRISYIGYNSKIINLSELSAEEVRIFSLEPKIISSQTVLVTSSIASEGITPITFSKVRRSEIESNYTVQDVPKYLSSLPSTTFYSESGNDVGYNYLNIRGFDQRRISVSVNGIPQNDPEDHNVYWLDFPDVLSSTELIQVQRGAGAGSIGYPAIGGAINIITATFSNAPKFEVSTALGSYNTRKYSASFSSGLIGNKYSIYAKLGKILSSGYRDLAWADYNSYHISAVRYDENVTSQINFYGGPISDGLSYTGLPKEYIKDKLLRKKNYSDWGPDGQGGLYTVNRKPTEIENFSQPHFELLNDIRFNENVSLNSALFLILGSGFYDYDAYWADKNYFRLTPENGFVDNGEALIDPLIRAQVDNKQFGWIPKMSLKHVNGELIIGSELRFHRSLHWGGISYAGNLPAGTDKDYRYYEYKGKNDIVNLFAHENYNISDKFNMSAEIQLAYHQYGIYNEKYVGNEFSIHNMFINPRLGINYKNNDNLNIYFSYARVNHEPRLKNYYDAAEASGGAIPQFERLSDGSYDYSNPLVKPETMNDIELGSNFSNTFLSAGCSLFYMYFNNEIVKNGQVDRFGQPITGNIDHTIHTGLELTAALKINSYLEFLFNSTLSKNYIGSGGEWINYKVGEDAKVNYLLDLSGNRISGFPDFLSNLSVKYKYSGLTVLLTMKYMGSYYSDNYDKHLIEYQAKYPFFEVPYNDNKVDDYFSSDFFASFEMKNIALGNSLKVYLQVNNIFDRFYATYAIGKEFFPGAERNVIGGVQLDL